MTRTRFSTFHYTDLERKWDKTLIRQAENLHIIGADELNTEQLETAVRTAMEEKGKNWSTFLAKKPVPSFIHPPHTVDQLFYNARSDPTYLTTYISEQPYRDFGPDLFLEVALELEDIMAVRMLLDQGVVSLNEIPPVDPRGEEEETEEKKTTKKPVRIGPSDERAKASTKGPIKKTSKTPVKKPIKQTSKTPVRKEDLDEVPSSKVPTKLTFHLDYYLKNGKNAGFVAQLLDLGALTTRDMVYKSQSAPIAELLIARQPFFENGSVGKINRVTVPEVAAVFFQQGNQLPLDQLVNLSRRNGDYLVVIIQQVLENNYLDEEDKKDKPQETALELLTSRLVQYGRPEQIEALQDQLRFDPLNIQAALRRHLVGLTEEKNREEIQTVIDLILTQHPEFVFQFPKVIEENTDRELLPFLAAWGYPVPAEIFNLLPSVVMKAVLPYYYGQVTLNAVQIAADRSDFALVDQLLRRAELNKEITNLVPFMDNIEQFGAYFTHPDLLVKEVEQLQNKRQDTLDQVQQDIQAEEKKLVDLKAKQRQTEQGLENTRQALVYLQERVRLNQADPYQLSEAGVPLYFDRAKHCDYVYLETRLLDKSAARLDWSYQDEQGRNLFHLLVQQCPDPRSLTHLAQLAPELLLVKDKQGLVPLDYWRLNPAPLELLTAYLSLDFPPDHPFFSRHRELIDRVLSVRDDEGRTALFDVIIEGTNLALLDQLLHTQVDPWWEDKTGRNAFDYADEYVKYEPMRLYLRNYLTEARDFEYPEDETEINPYVLNRAGPNMKPIIAPAGQKYLDERPVASVKETPRTVIPIPPIPRRDLIEEAYEDSEDEYDRMSRQELLAELERRHAFILDQKRNTEDRLRKLLRTDDYGALKLKVDDMTLTELIAEGERRGLSEAKGRNKVALRSAISQNIRSRGGKITNYDIMGPKELNEKLTGLGQSVPGISLEEKRQLLRRLVQEENSREGSE